LRERFAAASGMDGQACSGGLQRESKISINLDLLNPPEATDRTKSTSSSSLKVGSQSFTSRNVIAAFAPTRLLPSMKAWF
jgi:hypothetical protein